MKPQSAPLRLTPPLIGFRFALRQFACTLLLAGSLSAVPALGSPAGELDPAFGDHGRILLHESEFEEFRGVDVFVDPGSGSLLAVGSGWYRHTLLRFNSDGSLDSAFGNQGAVPLDFGDDSLEILDVEQLADGSLLIAGAMNAYYDPDNVFHGSGLLSRINADGSPDQSFGSSGRAIFQLGGVYEALSEIMVQADGGIVVLGSTNRTGSIERILARYTADGLPDGSFGNGATPGIGIIDVAGIDANLAAIVQQSDGKFLACGNATSNTDSSTSIEVLAVRIRPDGVRDPTFGNNGVVSIGGWQESVQIGDCLDLADGHLLFAGSSGSGERQRAAVLRLTPDGRLDAAFGDNGLVVLDTHLPSSATTMLVMSDGALAIAGSQWKPRDEWFSWADMLVTRIDPTSGAIDRGFGNRGLTAVDFGTRGFPGVASPARLRQQPDGKLVIIGSQVDLYDWYPAFSIAITRIDPYGSGSNGWAGLTATYATVPPAADTIALHLRRTGGGTGQLSVDYRTADDTATAGVDYVAGSGTVVWSDGDLSEKTLSITLLNADSVAEYRHLSVELFNSSGGLAMDRATITISPSESSSGSPPPATPPPVRGTSAGGGAIGGELWFVIVLAIFGVMKQISIFRAVTHNYQESPMTKQTITMNKKTLTAVIAIVMVSAFSPTTTDAHASTSMHRSVEGVWMVATTPRNCVTQVPVPGAAFEGLFTFHKDGTMSAWVQNSVVTVTRSPSQGLWQRDLGWRKYVFKFIHLRYDASGLYSGMQESGGTLVLDKSGNEFTTDSATSVFDVDGNVLGGGCATAVGTRFDWDE